MIRTQFAFEYEVVKVDPQTKEKTTSLVWTTTWNKKALMTEHVISVKIKQNNNDTRT